MIKGCFSIASVIMTSFLFLLPSNITEQTTNSAFDELLMLDACTEPPCLFGHSLKDAGYEQIENILLESSLVDTSTLVRDDISLMWHWSEQAILELTPASDYPPFYDNSVVFKDGTVASVNLIFTTQLDEIIHRWGEPNIIIPLNYDRWGNMGILLPYNHPAGFFFVTTDCEQPKLESDSLVLYHRSTTPESLVLDLKIPWSGYSTELPDYTIFQP